MINYNWKIVSDSASHTEEIPKNTGLKVDFKDALTLENVISVRAKGFRVCRCFPKMWQETEIMYQNTCCTHFQQNDSSHLHISISISLSKS